MNEESKVAEGGFASQKEIDIHVGKKLRSLRRLNGQTQQGLGDKVGVTYQQMQKYEHGMNRISAGKLYFFAKELGVEVSYFFLGLPGYEEAEERNFLMLNDDLLCTKDSLQILKKISALKNDSVRTSLKNLIENLQL